MRPNDENGNLPTAKRPFRVFIIAGSDRGRDNCPGRKGVVAYPASRRNDEYASSSVLWKDGLGKALISCVNSLGEFGRIVW
jgi:hypothetical protein